MCGPIAKQLRCLYLCVCVSMCLCVCVSDDVAFGGFSLEGPPAP